MLNINMHDKRIVFAALALIAMILVLVAIPKQPSIQDLDAKVKAEKVKMNTERDEKIKELTKCIIGIKKEYDSLEPIKLCPEYNTTNTGAEAPSATSSGVSTEAPQA